MVILGIYFKTILRIKEKYDLSYLTEIHKRNSQLITFDTILISNSIKITTYLMEVS